MAIIQVEIDCDGEYCAGCDYYESPAFIYDPDDLRCGCKAYCTLFPGNQLDDAHSIDKVAHRCQECLDSEERTITGVGCDKEAVNAQDIEYLIERLEKTADHIRNGDNHMALAKILADIAALKGFL